MHVKAHALAHMGGSANLAAAIALYDCVIGINTAALGADHVATAADAAPEGECVGAHRWIGQPRRSGSAYDRVIEINTAALGADHPETASARHTKRVALVNANRFGTAATS
jgi:hypothetical protein